MSSRTVFFNPGGGSGGSNPPGPPPDILLSPEQVRVLASLHEKQVTTPDYYPMTLNGLVNACNQKTNREPVTAYDDATVLAALDLSQHQGLVRRLTGADHRVPKFFQAFTEAFHLKEPAAAVINVLMLRGPQTLGELRERAGRLYPFASLAEVEETLDELAARERPLVVRLERLPGTKEPRYAHLLSGPVEAAAIAVETPRSSDRVSKLEEEVASLRDEVRALRAEVEAFRRQFE